MINSYEKQQNSTAMTWLQLLIKENTTLYSLIYFLYFTFSLKIANYKLKIYFSGKY